jgi:hypothetical protein
VDEGNGDRRLPPITQYPATTSWWTIALWLVATAVIVTVAALVLTSIN